MSILNEKKEEEKTPKCEVKCTFGILTIPLTGFLAFKHVKMNGLDYYMYLSVCESVCRLKMFNKNKESLERNFIQEVK